MCVCIPCSSVIISLIILTAVQHAWTEYAHCTYVRNILLLIRKEKIFTAIAASHILIRPFMCEPVDVQCPYIHYTRYIHPDQPSHRLHPPHTLDSILIINIFYFSSSSHM